MDHCEFQVCLASTGGHTISGKETEEEWMGVRGRTERRWLGWKNKKINKQRSEILSQE